MRCNALVLRTVYVDSLRDIDVTTMDVKHIDSTSGGHQRVYIVQYVPRKKVAE